MKLALYAKYMISHLRNNHEDFYARLDDVSSLRPLRISVASTDRCNANCVFCARQHMDRFMGDMDPRIFERIVGQYSEELGGGEIGLGVAVGEPLLDRQFWSRFDAARRHGLSMVGFVTNFIRAREVGIERLLREGPPGVAVSFCPDRDGYRRIFRNRFYDKVWENIVELITLRNVVNPDFWIAVRIRFAGRRSKILASPDFARLAALLPERDLTKALCNRYDNWNGRIRALPKGMHLSKARAVKVFGKHVPCAQLYGLLCFLPDGSAVGCACRLVRPGDDLCVGSIRGASITELWNRLTEVRRRWRRGNVPSCCRNCSMYMPVTMGTDLAAFRRRYDAVNRLVPLKARSPAAFARRRASPHAHEPGPPGSAPAPHHVTVQPAVGNERPGNERSARN